MVLRVGLICHGSLHLTHYSAELPLRAGLTCAMSLSLICYSTELLLKAGSYVLYGALVLEERIDPKKYVAGSRSLRLGIKD